MISTIKLNKIYEDPFEIGNLVIHKDQTVVYVTDFKGDEFMGVVLFAPPLVRLEFCYPNKPICFNKEEFKTFRGQLIISN